MSMSAYLNPINSDSLSPFCFSGINCLSIIQNNCTSNRFLGLFLSFPSLCRNIDKELFGCMINSFLSQRSWVILFSLNILFLTFSTCWEFHGFSTGMWVDGIVLHGIGDAFPVHIWSSWCTTLCIQTMHYWWTNAYKLSIIKFAISVWKSFVVLSSPM